MRPADGTPDIVALIRAVAASRGADGLALSDAARQLQSQIGSPDHLVFVLIDGLGAELLATTPGCDFLKHHCRGELQSVFLSTTAAAITALATGVYPAEHGVPGWWTYLEERGLTALTLPFEERHTGVPLEARGLAAQSLLPAPPLLPRFTCDTLCLLPDRIADTTYTRYWSGQTPRAGYPLANPVAALDQLQARLAEVVAPSYTYVYLPQVDSLCHEYGVDHPDIATLLSIIDAALSGLRSAVGDSVRLVISADHGHVNVPAERAHVLACDDPLMSHLRCAPTGEPGIPICHVAPGHVDAFVAAFRDRFGDAFALLPNAAAQSLRLFGPRPIAAELCSRFGDFIAIPPRPTTICFAPRDEEPTIHRGVHGGLTSGEMRVPLIIA